MGIRSSAMEELGMTFFDDIYRGKRVLITGHTGFKGSWLALWLKELGAVVTGAALPAATVPNHWGIIRCNNVEHHIDIRDPETLAALVKSVQPEMVFHLAAQSLVRRSYREPLETWSTNVMGTANLIEACRKTNSVKAMVVVTTDKCYENQGWPWGYRENDRLGGHDPYSASKAGTELVAASYRSAFFDSIESPLLATARAGNVIGGGDWADDRLIPDIVRAVGAGRSLEIRSPRATRPWQHVLDCLSGYLMLGENLLKGRKEFAQAWNFGPEVASNRTVAEVLESLKESWPEMQWHKSDKTQPHEANWLYLDSSKANTILKWRPTWHFEETLGATADWYRAWLEFGRASSEKQIAIYAEDAKRANAQWVRA